MERGISSCEVKREPQVLQELSVLDTRISRLHELINTVRSRVNPVLRPVPAAGGETPKNTEALVPLAADIRLYRSRIEECNDILSEIIDTCEL